MQCEWMYGGEVKSTLRVKKMSGSDGRWAGWIKGSEGKGGNLFSGS